VRNRLPIAWLIAVTSLTLADIGAAGDAPAPPGTDDWKYDVLHRKQGKPYQGLVVEDAPDHVLIKSVSRKPGSPTVVITEWFPRSEVDHLDLLAEPERALLRGRLRRLALEREQLASRLRASEGRGEEGSDPLDLRAVAWPIDPGGQALEYHSTYFRLVSTGRPEVVRLAAVELEQVFTAYARALPPAAKPGEPTTVLLLPSVAEYRALVRQRGYNLLNPAYYDASRNQVVCASDLQRLADENERVRLGHERQREAIKATEAELRKAYRDRVPPDLLIPLEEARQQMRATEERNAGALGLARRQLFRRLCHEAFHAYLAAYVYPPAEGEIPRWLNEGLAQIFETSIVEVGELRVGHTDAEHYNALRQALRNGDMLPLADLLRSGAKQFLVAHGSGQQVSDRHYLASRALAFHLTFERRLLGTRRFDEYVRALRRGADPVSAFEELVGEPLTRFEREHLAYLERLRPDGTTGSARK
jgi:hypothetical protein